MDRQAKFIRQRQRQFPLLRVPSSFGHYKSGDIHHAFEHFRLADGILSGSGIEHLL